MFQHAIASSNLYRTQFIENIVKSIMESVYAENINDLLFENKFRFFFDLN